MIDDFCQTRSNVPKTGPSVRMAAPSRKDRADKAVRNLLRRASKTDQKIDFCPVMARCTQRRFAVNEVSLMPAGRASTGRASPHAVEPIWPSDGWRGCRATARLQRYQQEAGLGGVDWPCDLA
jgi:hypothetical protein